MKLPLKQEIIDFVHRTYGESASKQLSHIHRGGSNNQKGRDYENQFLLFKTFEIANKYPHDCANQVIEAQTIGFVDDICHIDYEKNIKYNYQAKNSSGEAAKWTEDISDRFRRQRLIDTTIFKVSCTQNCLLVSDENRALANKALIPNDLKRKDSCEYFKFHPNAYELVRHTKLSLYVANLIGTSSSSDCDYAISLIHGVLQAGRHTTVKEIFKQAESDAHPNPFIKFRTSAHELPNWVQQILTKYSHCVGYSLNYDVFILTVNQNLNVTCRIDLLETVPESVIENTQSIQELVKLIFLLTGDNMIRSLNVSNTGEVK